MLAMGGMSIPLRGLLDLLTIKEKKGEVKGLRVAIVGDLAHSRVARSDIHALKKMGADVVAVGPPTMIPPYLDRLGVKVMHNLDKALSGVDVIIMLRLQLERQGGSLFPTTREYARLYGLTSERVEMAAKDALVMHPGPIFFKA